MLASASQLERALLCPASALLPKNRREQGTSAKRGSLIHALIAAELRGWEKPDIGRYKVKYDLEALRPYLIGETKCELAMGWDPVTREGKILGENLGREYDAPGCLVGAADIVDYRKTKFHALVIDVKTGQRRGPAADSWQLKTLSVMIASVYDVESVTACLAYLGRDGSWTFDDVTWGAFSLDAIADDLAKYAKHAKAQAELYADGWEPIANPSIDNCRYCECECANRYQEAA